MARKGRSDKASRAYPKGTSRSSGTNGYTGESVARKRGTLPSGAAYSSTRFTDPKTGSVRKSTSIDRGGSTSSLPRGAKKVVQKSVRKDTSGGKVSKTANRLTLKISKSGRESADSMVRKIKKA